MKTKATKPTILLVDDDPGVFDIVSQGLKGEFYILSASDGVEALEVLSNVLPSLIIIDILMPNINGFELAKKIKADKTLATVPFIFLSSVTRTQDVHAALSLGPMEFINKPVDTSRLEKTIRELMFLGV